MTETTARIKVRQGNIADLPALAPGEQGYALDTRQLFIGNTPITRSGTGQADYQFGIDLDDIKHKITVDDVLQEQPAHYVIADDGYRVSFQPGHEPAVDSIITLKYNTEIQTSYTPDQEKNLSLPTKTLAGSVTNETIPSVAIDTVAHTGATLTYELSTTDTVRRGKIEISFVGSTFILDDNYITSNEEDLPHTFSGVIQNDIFTLNYTTSSADTATFKYTEETWLNS